MKIRLQEVDYACLIALTWPAQVWYPQVLRMLVNPSHRAGSPVSSRLEPSPFDSRELVVSNCMAYLR